MAGQRISTARVVLVAIALLCQWLLQASAIGPELEVKFLDWWFRLRGATAAPNNVVIVSIDEESYRALDVPLNQPWPRALHAELLQRLQALGAKRVVFDIVFAGSSGFPEMDLALAKAVGLNETVLGADHGVRDHGYYVTQELISPLPLIADNARTVALVGLPEDHGQVRRFLTQRVELTEELPTLAEAAAGFTTNPNRASIVPLPSGDSFINFYGPAGTIHNFPYYQVLETERPLATQNFAGKVVFVGLMLRTSTGPAQKDSYLTSFPDRGRTYGVEIHATAAANLMNRNWIAKIAPQTGAAVALILAVVGALGIAMLAPQWAAVLLVGLVGSWLTAAYVSLLSGILLPGASWALVTMPLIFVISAVTSYLIARRAFQQTRLAFQFYLAPEMVREVARNPETLKPGGHKIEATALFMDIADFTTICEQLSAEQVAAMLNAYFTVVGEVIFKYRGTLIKYIGDAIFVLWGAPVSQPDQRQLACKAALEIQQTLLQFNAQKKFPELTTRIGINTGPMVVGNLGSNRRFDYTAIGDAVNLASRTEGVNKYFGTTLLVTGDTLLPEARDTTSLFMGRIRVKGKDQPVELFALRERPWNSAAIEQWNAARTDFSNQNLAAAAVGFTKLAEQFPELKVAAGAYIAQISRARRTAVETSADLVGGVLELDEK